MTGRYDIETGKPDAEILTPRGQDLASTFKKLHLPLSSCPISRQMQKVLVEIPNGSSDKSEDRNSGEFTQEMREENLVEALSILNWRIQAEVAKYLYYEVRWCF